MNTIAHAGGLVATMFLARFAFVDFGEPVLGWAFIVVSVWVFSSMLLAIHHDWMVRFGGGD